MPQHDPSSEPQEIQTGTAQEDSSSDERGSREHERESPWAFWRGVLITLGVALGVRQFILEARYIPSGSMLPGLQIQDRLLVEKLSYRQRPPRRGEIVVFHAPHHFDPVLMADNQAGPLRCLLEIGRAHV